MLNLLCVGKVALDQFFYQYVDFSGRYRSAVHFFYRPSAFYNVNGSQSRYIKTPLSLSLGHA